MDNIIFLSKYYASCPAEIENATICEDLKIAELSELDDWINNLIDRVLSDHLYKNIFLPLSFGQSIVDFLGLRFALHIRTQKKCKNQCSNIFIYGTENLDNLINNEFFDIFKTKGIRLIDYSKSSFISVSKINDLVLNIDSLSQEMSKLKLNIPANLFDNHSIANIWGMYRLLELDGIQFENIETLKNIRNSLNNVYFKWLMAKNEAAELITEEVKIVRKTYAEQLPGPKIVGKIELPINNKRSKK